MPEKIKQLIYSLDISQDQEKCEAQIHTLLKSTPDVIAHIIRIARNISDKETDYPVKKKRLRTIIFILSIALKKNRFLPETSSEHKSATDLLFDLSIQGYQSAANVLQHNGFSGSDILRKKLLALPQTEFHKNDKTVSLNEAMEEIKLSKSYSGSKGFMKDCYLLGKEGRFIFDLHRTGKNTFSLRRHKA